MKKRRSHKLRNGALAGGVIAAALIYLECDGTLGVVGNGTGPRGSDSAEDTGDAPSDRAASADASAEAAARCQLRLDRAGLTMSGEPVAVDGAVDACERAGAADFVVTGDARYGTFENIRDALEDAGVEVYLR